MKPFDLIQAKNGKAVITRRGDRVTILKTDLINTHPLVVSILDKDIHKEDIMKYTADGKFGNPEKEHPLDLFMKTEPIELYCNVYRVDDVERTGYYETDKKLYFNKCVAYADRSEKNYVDTVKVTIEI